MKFLNRKEKKEKRAEKPEQESLSADVLFSMICGERMTADKAMQLPAVARCVNMIAYAAAALPVKLYRRTDKGVEEITDDPRLEMLQSRSGDTLNASEQRFKWVTDYLLYGNAYGYYESGYISRRPSLYYVSPLSVSVKANRTDPIHKVYMYNVGGREYYPYKFLKILRCSDGYGRGRGIVEENRLAFSVAYSTMKLEEKLVQKGGNKKGFLKSEKHLSDNAMDALKNAWRKLYSNEGDGCIILNDGMDFKEASSTNVEMQLNENKKSNAAELMRLFGTSDGILSDDTVKNAVMPVLDAFEAAFDADLLEENEKGTHYFAFDTRELTRGDIAQRYNAYAVALDKNFMQLDEVRALEDLPPLGVNFIKLGLNDVLLDLKTNRVYTPNTNAWADLGAGADISAENGMEMRFNPYHDPATGRFTTADGGGSGTYLFVGKGEKGKGQYVVAKDLFNAPDGLSNATDAQKHSMERIDRIISERVLKGERLTPVEYNMGDDRKISFAYNETKTVIDVHSGKMLDMGKDKFYDKTHTLTGIIYDNGKVVFTNNAITSKPVSNVYLGTRKQLVKAGIIPDWRAEPDNGLTDEENSDIIKSETRFAGQKRKPNGQFDYDSSYIKQTASGGTIDLRKCKEGINYDSNDKPYVPVDSKGKPFTRANYHLTKKEYGKVIRQVNSSYDGRFKEKERGWITIAKTTYWFEIHDFDDYNIFNKGIN